VVNSTDGWLLDFFDAHKDGKIMIEHQWNEKECSAPITLLQVFKMFKAVYERDMNSVHQD